MRWRVALKVLSDGMTPPEFGGQRLKHRESTVDEAVRTVYRIVRRDQRRRRREVARG